MNGIIPRLKSKSDKDIYGLSKKIETIFAQLSTGSFCCHQSCGDFKIVLFSIKN